MKIFQFITFHTKVHRSKTIAYYVQFIVSLDGKIEHLVLFDYELFDKICNKIEYLISKKVVLQIVLIIILERSKLIHIIICQLKKY